MRNHLEYRMYLKRNELIKLLKLNKKIPFKLMNEYNILVNKTVKDRPL